MSAFAGKQTSRMTARNVGCTDVLLLVIGALLLVLLTAALARYSTSWQGLEDSDRLGALIFLSS
jgi:hypothetical protein